MYVFLESLVPYGNEALLAMALCRCVLLLVVQEDVFLFNADAMEQDMAGESGTLNLMVEPNPPNAVMIGWNDDTIDPG